MNNRAIGNIYEEKATQILRNSGYEILERNYRNKFGEIDIVAKNGEIIVFVEVKYRRNLKYGNGLEAIDKNKSKKIYKAAQFYILKNRIDDMCIRFDAITFLGERVKWEKNLIWGDEIGF